MEYTHILVAVDGSKEGERALEKAIQVTKRNNATLHIAHVIEITTYSDLDALQTVVTDRMVEYATNLLEEYKKTALAAGIPVETILEYGDPKRDIAKKIASSHDINLIICGAKGLNTLERIFIGSVSENITRHASCDVLVIRD